MKCLVKLIATCKYRMLANGAATSSGGIIATGGSKERIAVSTLAEVASGTILLKKDVTCHQIET
eukprot:6456162-Amphidinium_carterae.1